MANEPRKLQGGLVVPVDQAEASRLRREITSLQTALAAATEDAENWRKDVSRWKQNFKEVNEQLAAANARADEAEHCLAEERKERVATQAFAQGEYLRLEKKIEQANARAEATEASLAMLEGYETHHLEQLQAQRERAEAAERERDDMLMRLSVADSLIKLAVLMVNDDDRDSFMEEVGAWRKHIVPVLRHR